MATTYRDVEFFNGNIASEIFVVLVSSYPKDFGFKPTWPVAQRM
jgi:hypothetical protein